MALKSDRSRLRLKDIESVQPFETVRRAGLSATTPEPPANEERGMSSQPLPVGEELRRAREDAGLDLADVAAHLRIRSNFLSALEEGRPDALPGITYAIGYVRTYAAFLGLEPDAAVRRFKEEAAGLNSKTQLVFPSPAPEGRVPGLVLMLVAVMLAGGAYGGWYWLSERDGSLRDLVPAVPERLAQLIGGEAPSLPPAAPATATAGSYADANPTGVTVPRPAAPAPSAPPQPAATVSTAEPAAPAKPATRGPAAEAPAAGTAASTAGGIAATAPAPTTAAAPPAAPASSPTVAASDAATRPARTAAEDTPDVTAPPEPAGAAETAVTHTAAAEPAATPTAATGTAAARSATAEPAPDTAAAGGTAPRSAADEVPAAPRIAALIGSSEAAVPPGRTTAGPIDRVLVKATGDSWVQVRDAQGTALFTRVLREGDVYRVPDQPGLRLATGNAGALQILVDGNPVPSLGGYGEVVRNVLLDPARLAAGTATGASR
jgi:cytoskeleton protein RodZ